MDEMGADSQILTKQIVSFQPLSVSCQNPENLSHMAEFKYKAAFCSFILMQQLKRMCFFHFSSGLVESPAETNCQSPTAMCKSSDSRKSILHG